MKIVIAPDSFKESLSANAVASAIAKGLLSIDADLEIIQVPLADGGEGSVDVLIKARQGQKIVCEVEDALGRLVKATYGIYDHTAVIEMAAAAGLDLIEKSQRNPTITSTFGVGELMNDALNKGIDTMIIGLGGSATNDAGAGMLQALGVKLYDIDGKVLGKGGLALKDVAHIDTTQLDKRWQQVKIKIACDVRAPLWGEKGASVIFARQKGADTVSIVQLDAALAHFSDICEAEGFARKSDIAGAGAAGGLGFGLLTFLDAQVFSGVDLIMNAVQIDAYLQDADLVITGEGKMDRQTATGKVPQGVLEKAKQYHIPCIAICGAVDSALVTQDFLAVFPTISELMSWDELVSVCEKNLTRTAAQIMRLIQYQAMMMS